MSIPHWLRRPSEHTLDGFLVAGLLLAGLLNLQFAAAYYDPNTPPHWVDLFSTVVCTGVLWFRRGAPLMVLMVIVAAQSVPDLITPTSLVFWGEWVPLLVASYAVAVRRTGWAQWVALIAGAGVFFVLGRTDPEFRGAAAAAFWFGAQGAALLAGNAIQHLRARTQGLAELAVDLERNTERRAREAVSLERRRIARELHDIISHHVTVMVVQSSGARAQLRGRPDLAEDALDQVQRLGRQALDEMQLLLGVLRDEDDRDQLDPAPSLLQIGQLVDHLEEAGTPVSLGIDGDLAQLPPAIDLAGYRIVQEAMTNALRHAPHAPVKVRLGLHSGHLVVEVDNLASPYPPVSPRGSGRGLLGVAERVKLHGGHLDAQPTAQGGFRVHARLPVPEAAR